MAKKPTTKEAPHVQVEKEAEVEAPKEVAPVVFEKESPLLHEVELVLMVRDPALYPAPHDATVHPLEVENYRVGGWVLPEELKTNER